MNLFVGKYEAYKSEECAPFFAVTVPGENGKSIADMKAVLEVKQHGSDDVYEFVHQIPTKTIRTVFKVGVPFLDEVPTGNVFQSVATKEGDILKIKSTFEGNDYGGRDLEFTQDGLTVTIHVPKLTPIKAVRHYRRCSTQ